MDFSDAAPFSLNEVAGKLGIEINDLLRLAVSKNGFKLATWYEGPAAHKDFDCPGKPGYSKNYNGWATVPANMIGLLIVEEAISVKVLIKEGHCCFIPLEHDNDLGPDANYPTTKHTVYREKLVVMASELARMEKKYPELKPITGLEVNKEIPAYLKTEIKEHAPKLAVAVAAWEAVALKPIPRGKTPKQALVDWLSKEENINKYSRVLRKPDGTSNKLAIDEIAKIANWQFEGPPKS